MTKHGLLFFGNVTASISHELKNVTAIINENVGLLEDMLLMQQKGAELNIERLARMQKNLAKQIDRSDEIITNLNIFAHSIDEAQKEIKTHEFLEYIIRISSRLTSMNSVTSELDNSSENITLNTNAFYLLNLLWMIIIKSSKSINSGDKIILSSKSFNNYKAILINLHQVSDEFLDNIKNDVQIIAALDTLGYEIEVDYKNAEIKIIINN